MATITDGKGRGYSVGVDSTNRLEVSAAVFDEERLATYEGTAFAITSGLVSFTAATDSAVLYIKNEAIKALVLDRFRLMLGTVTGGTGDWTLRIVRNPTVGTIVSNALAAGITNVNHGSSIEPSGVFLRGIEGDTLTDGTSGPFPIKSSGENQLIIPLGRILPTGSSVGVRLTPPTGTTAASAFVVARTYYPVSE
jgi:hypothetical protein